MYPTEVEITREQMLELLADVTFAGHFGASEDAIQADKTWHWVMRPAQITLDVGGAIGVYVRFDRPDQLTIPSGTYDYKVGYLRTKPRKGRLINHVDHYQPVGQEADETTHIIGRYEGDPFTGDEIDAARMRAVERTYQECPGVPDTWVRRVYGDPPPTEVLANLNRRHFEQHSNWLWGPAHELARATRCRHEYGMFDSCPGCDHDEEMGLGPWAESEVNA